MNTINIAAIATKLELREFELLQILEILVREKSIDNQELARLTVMPKTNLGRLLKEISFFLEPPSKNVVIRPEAVSYIEVLLKESREKPSYEEIKNKIKQVLSNYKSERPLPERTLDQFTATDETTIKRTLFLKQRGDLFKRNVAFIGDDDLVSIATALSMHPAKITVFEIDKRLVSLINRISKEEKLQIETIQYDARQSLPIKYLNQYNTIFTDPPYTPSGISLFLNRGIELLKKNFTSRIYLCYGNSDRARERELEIQRLINQKDLLIKTKLDNFNKYYGAESIGSSSSLYLCDWTPKTHTTRVSEKSLYTTV